MIPVACAKGHRLGSAETLHDAAALLSLHTNTEHGGRLRTDDVAAALHRALAAPAGSAAPLAVTP